LSVPDLLVGRLQNLDLTIGMLASASRYCGAASTDQRQCHRHSRRRRASCGHAPGRAADGPASGPRGSGGRTCTSWSRVPAGRRDRGGRAAVGLGRAGCLTRFWQRGRYPGYRDVLDTGDSEQGGPNEPRDSLRALHRSDQTAVERRPLPSVRGAAVSGREREGYAWSWLTRPPGIRWLAVCLPLSVPAGEEGRADGRRL
jgi:hypothetical protein